MARVIAVARGFAGPMPVADGSAAGARPATRDGSSAAAAGEPDAELARGATTGAPSGRFGLAELFGPVGPEGKMRGVASATASGAGPVGVGSIGLRASN
jgi:hypothetical protein